MIKKEYLFLHLSILLFGSAGIFTQLVHLDALYIVQGRLFFAVISLFLINFITKDPLRLLRQDIISFLVSSVILALHWYSFFKSIQLIGIASGLMFFVTYPIFTGLINIFIFKEKISSAFFVSLSICILGLFIMNAHAVISPESWIGIFWGLCSSLTFAMLGFYNQKLIKTYTAPNIALIQFSLSFLVLLPFSAHFSLSDIIITDLLYLMLLGSVFTALSHALFIASMKRLPIIYVALSSCMEAVYGVILSVLFFNQELSLYAIIGAIFVVGSAMTETYRHFRTTINI